MRIVQKFGGSSLADLSCLRRAAEHCLEARRRGCEVLAVVSAAGESTDEMLRLAHEITPRPAVRELDALLATGEQRSAALMAIQLEVLGALARSYSGWQAGLITEEKHGDARLLLAAPRRLLASLAAGEIPVVAGFQGITPAGDISTLGRGGSDTTAVALAAALQADRCEIYTDVDGIYTADPRLVEEARLIPAIDFRDMLALAQAGSQVLHAESVRLAASERQPIRLLSTFTASPGSEVRALAEDERPALAGVTRDEAAHSVTIVGREAARTATALLREELLPAESVTGCVAAENAAVLQVRPGTELSVLRAVHRAVWR
ncbi:MAG: aspartate kinase [Eubacteriales bacterium]|nr:aspartate kinase [Eubacteriales bacterium]